MVAVVEVKSELSSTINTTTTNTATTFTIMMSNIKYYSSLSPLPDYLHPNHRNHLMYFKFLYLFYRFTTTAGSPQQHMAITAVPYYLTHTVNFLCTRKPEYPEKDHDLRQSVHCLTLLTWDLGFSHIEMILLRLKHATLQVRDEWLNHFATEVP